MVSSRYICLRKNNHRHVRVNMKRSTPFQWHPLAPEKAVWWLSLATGSSGNTIFVPEIRCAHPDQCMTSTATHSPRPVHENVCAALTSWKKLCTSTNGRPSLISSRVRARASTPFCDSHVSPAASKQCLTAHTLMDATQALWPM